MYPNEDELSAFYGFTYSSFNVIGFVIQLFFTSKILKKIGISNTLLILPLSILFSLLGLLFIPGLFFALILKMSDSSFKQSFQRSAMELTMIPVPLLIKAKVKPFIDVFIDSIATGLAGLLLILLTASTLDKSLWTMFAGITFTIIWVMLTQKTKKVYFQSYAQSSNQEDSKVLSPNAFKENLKYLKSEHNFEELQSMLSTHTKYEGLGMDGELIELYSWDRKTKVGDYGFSVFQSRYLYSHFTYR